MNATLRSRGVWIVLVVGIVLIWSVSTQFQAGDDSVSFSEFVQWVDAGQVESVILTGNKITGSSRSGDRFRTYAPPQYDGLVNTLVGVDIFSTLIDAVFTRSVVDPDSENLTAGASRGIGGCAIGVRR